MPVSYSQQANTWYFGERAGISFNSNPPSALTDGQVNTNEGCAVMSDNNGRLLFYTDGITVWNKLHQPMPNGTGLKGHFSSSNSAIIVPRPGSSTIYYVFTAGAEDNFNEGYFFSEVDMSLQNGMGDITGTKNSLLYSPGTEKLTAVGHSNGIDVWVITRVRGIAAWKTFKVTCDGVNTTPVNSISDYPSSALWKDASVGCLKASRDGTKIAATNATEDLWELLKFDATTGILSDNLIFPSFEAPYGIEFSPDSKLIYIANLAIPQTLKGAISQYSLATYDPAAIESSKILVGHTSGFTGALQMGPDNKIYCSVRSSPFLAAVNFPDVRGIGCGFVDSQVHLGGRSPFFGLPASFRRTITRNNIDFNYTITNCTTVNFLASAAITENITWSWDFGDGNSSALQNPSNVYSTTGNYAVRLVVQTLGCSSDTLVKPVALVPATAFAGNDTVVAAGQPIQFHATGGKSFKWTPPDFLDKDTVSNPVAILQKDQRYQIKITTAEGCVDVDDIFIRIMKGPYVYVPNAFTPGGKNKVFRPILVGVQELYYFSVYNRWGQLVFTTKEPGMGWDGRINGAIQSTGTYVWMLRAKDYLGQVITKNGMVVLVQ